MMGASNNGKGASRRKPTYPPDVQIAELRMQVRQLEDDKALLMRMLALAMHEARRE